MGVGWLEVLHSGQCQAPANQRQSSLWLAAGQTAGRVGMSGSLSDAEGEASWPTDSGARSGSSVQALFSTAGLL